MSNQSRRKNSLLPQITDLESAQAAGRQGTVASVVVIIMTTVAAIITHLMPPDTKSVLMVTPAGAIITCVIYGTLAVMIYRMSCVAAVLALLVYLVDRVFLIAQQGNSIGYASAIVIIFALINSVRGTFAYHRFHQQRQESINQPIQQLDRVSPP
jgi:hypothetical protein